MKIMYIDAQNVHKGIETLGWIIDWKKFYNYSKTKFGLNEIKIFMGYLKRYDAFYKKLSNIGYKVIFKNAMTLPNGQTKGNVDIDIAIDSLTDYYEGYLDKAYLVTSDGDYNTLVEKFREKGVLGRVVIPSRESASILLKRAARGDLQSIQDLRYQLEKN